MKRLNSAGKKLVSWHKQLEGLNDLYPVENDKFNDLSSSCGRGQLFRTCWDITSTTEQVCTTTHNMNE